MKKLHLIFTALLASLAFAACTPVDDPTGENEIPHERIIFTLLNSEEPLVAAPDSDVSYKFKVAYSGGLAAIHTSLNGEVIEGSEMSYSDAPTEVEYDFSYTVKGSQFGETLDFIFTATAADGYTQSVDYALYVTANAVEFTIIMPEKAPAEIYSDATVKFNVKVECGNFLKTFEVFKGEAAYDSVDNLNELKTYTYAFTYTPDAEDVGKDVVFHFVATDIKGNIAEGYYTVHIVKADAVGKMLYSETFNTSMSISTTTAFDTTEGGISGGAATQFDASNIAKYSSFYLPNPEDPEGEKIPNAGALEGCEVYDGDKSGLAYTSDGVDVCLSKYAASSVPNVSGTYLWYRKAKKGWVRVDGIKLHGATSLKLTHSQAGGSLKVEYSLDNGSSWTEVESANGAAEVHEAKFDLTQSAETISLRFTENDGTAHCRIDNIKLVEVL